MASARPILTSNYHLEAFARRAAKTLSAGQRMLDAGAGDSPYRPLFSHAHYEAADICKRAAHAYSHVQYVCDLTAIPVEDERYDLVLCTQVLEHVPDPRSVLAELRRVVKPGAQLWISAPLSFHEHEVPHDYFRYTRFGWAELLAGAGLELVQLEWLQGYAGTVAYQLNLARHFLPLNAKHYGGGLPGVLGSALSLFLRPLLIGAAYAYSRLDMRHRYTLQGHPLDYCVVARRPVGA
jgi:SAM-dependent methyltransferase